MLFLYQYAVKETYIEYEVITFMNSISKSIKCALAYVLYLSMSSVLNKNDLFQTRCLYITRNKGISKISN